MTERVPQRFVECATFMADAARAIARRHFRQPFDIESKADASPVTIADREVEAALRAIVAESFPDHGIIGEEMGTSAPDAEYVWVLDPIDGTSAFTMGIPVFGTLIALTRGGHALLGVIEQAIQRERWVGGAGLPTTLNGKPVRTAPCRGLARARLMTTTPAMYGTADLRAAFARVRDRARIVRYGADCYAYGMLAAGHVDVVVEADLKPYDFAALVPVIEAAGGVVTDWQGRQLHNASDGCIVAAGDPACHAEALAALADKRA